MMTIITIMITAAIMIVFGYAYHKAVQEDICMQNGSIMSRCNYAELADKQAYVKANMDKFGCKDHGTSLDEREIYVVSVEDMGLNPTNEWDTRFSYEDCTTLNNMSAQGRSIQ